MMANEWRFVSKIAYIYPNKQGNAENNFNGIGCGGAGSLEVAQILGGSGGYGGAKRFGGIAEVLEALEVAEMPGG